MDNFDLNTIIERVNYVDPEYYKKYDVKRGLRNADGTGVITGITNIANVHGYTIVDGEKMPDEGMLRYRGYNLYDLVDVNDHEKRFNFEEIVYLLFTGELPTQERLNDFIAKIDEQRDLPDGFTASLFLLQTQPDTMNVLARSILQLYAYDERAEDRSYQHEIETAISLISRLPRITVLSYYNILHRYKNGSMIMHNFIPGQSTAETILSMLRPNREFTPDEARMLDVMLCLHVHYPSVKLGRYRPLFRLRCSHRLAERLPPRRGKPYGPRHAARNERKHCELGKRRRSCCLY